MERTEDFIDAREVYETELMEKGICPECEGIGSVVDEFALLEPCDICKSTGEYKKQ